MSRLVKPGLVMLCFMLGASHAFGQAAPVPPKPVILTPQTAPGQTAGAISQTAAPTQIQGPKAPQPVLRWVDVKGNLLSDITPTGLAWTWSQKTPSAPIKTPALRIWMKSGLQHDLKPEILSNEGVTVLTPPEFGDSPMILDLRSTRATVRFNFKDKAGQVTELSLVIEVVVPKTQAFSTPECQKMDFHLKVRRNEARHLYMGISCFDTGDAVDVFFFRSEDSKWNPDTEVAKYDPNNKAYEFKSHVPKPKEVIVYSRQLLPGGTADEFGGLTEYYILYTPKERPKPFYISAGAGPTYNVYTERNASMKMTMYSLTGKVNVGYRLIPGLLDVAMNMFGTIVPLSYTPTKLPGTTLDIPAPRFYGINGRLGYRLPIGMGATDLMFMAGWYFWGMIVNVSNPDALYGMKSLGGPQIFFMANNSAKGKAGQWIYFKLALMSDGLHLSGVNNREIAVGVGKQLSARENKPFAITLDIADARCSIPVNGMSLLTVALGLSKSIW